MKKNKIYNIIIIVFIIAIIAVIFFIKLQNTDMPECIYNDTPTVCTSDLSLKSCVNNKFITTECFYGCSEGYCCDADYSDVAVITNSRSKVSKDISKYFMEKRNVTNQFFIDVSEDENINYNTFNSSVIVPLKAYLLANPKIKYLVTTKGVPIRVTNTCAILYSTSLSFDSMVAGIFINSSKGECYGKTGNCYDNECYNGYTSSNWVTIPVTRLDGYTYEDAIKLITPRVCNNLNGLILLDQKGTGDQNGDPNLVKAYDDIFNNFKNNAVMLESTTKFIINKDNIDAYISWGSNDGHVIANSSQWNLSFNPGSIGDTWVSTSARSFKPGTTYGQSLIADLSHAGLSGVSGYVNEPGLSTVEEYDLISNYLSGKNLADSFYLSMPNVDWQTLVLGDPKLYVVQGGKKNSCSGVPCLNKCLNNNTLSYNGLCDGYGICQFKNMTCQYGCSNSVCNTPPSCSLSSYSCSNEIVTSYCAYRTFYNGFEYVHYNKAINLTGNIVKSASDDSCHNYFLYCIDGSAQCTKPDVINAGMIQITAVNGNTYYFVGNWINQSLLYDNNPNTYAVANITNGSAYVYINYTFTQKILSFTWNIYHDKGNYIADGNYGYYGNPLISPKTIGSNILQLRIQVAKTTSGYKVTYWYYDGAYWKYLYLDSLGSAPFNLNTNKIYDEEIVSIYTGDCYPNTVQCIANKQYKCNSAFRLIETNTFC